MGKIKASEVLQVNKHAQRNMRFNMKKQRTKKNKKTLNDLKKRNASNEITNVQNNKKKHKFLNKLTIKQIKMSNASTIYSKTDSIFQKTNAHSEVKRKKEKKEIVNRMCSDQINNNAPKVNVSEIKKTVAKQMKNFQQNKIPITKKTQQTKFEKILNLKAKNIEPKQTMKFIRLEKLLSNKSRRKQSKHEIREEQPLSLKDKMMIHLRASRFRFINETLYSNKSTQSNQYFKEDPDSFKAYHDGYNQQLEQWPINPLDIIISSIKKMPITNVIADFGCGEARLATSVSHIVHSFDFIALNDKVQACDMAHTPLLANSVHVVVFCLSLMGTNLNDYIMEANRVLKHNGILKIAEVESRFENLKDFLRLLHNYGFKNTWKDVSNNLFYFMDFKKEKDINMKTKNLPPISLKPCLYKKR